MRFDILNRLGVYQERDRRTDRQTDRQNRLLQIVQSNGLRYKKLQKLPGENNCHAQAIPLKGLIISLHLLLVPLLVYNSCVFSDLGLVPPPSFRESVVSCRH